MESAERNLKENDLLTAANRSFIACENAVYVLLKSKFGSSSVSRMKILTRLKEISSDAKDIYDNAYDLRVQADYGREARLFPLNKENVESSIKEVKKIVEKASEIVNEKSAKFKENEKGSAKSLLRFAGVLKDVDWNEREKKMKEFRASFNKRMEETAKYMEESRRK